MFVYLEYLHIIYVLYETSDDMKHLGLLLLKVEKMSICESNWVKLNLCFTNILLGMLKKKYSINKEIKVK